MKLTKILTFVFCGLILSGINAYGLQKIKAESIEGLEAVISNQIVEVGIDLAGVTNIVESISVLLTEKGAVNGVANLDATGRVPSSQLPAIGITDVIVIATTNDFPMSPSEGDIAIAIDAYTNEITGVTNSASYAYDGTDWKELLPVGSPVLSVNMEWGYVSLTLAKILNEGATVNQNILMDGNKLTGLGAGTVDGDSLRYEQLGYFPDGSMLVSEWDDSTNLLSIVSPDLLWTNMISYSWHE